VNQSRPWTPWHDRLHRHLLQQSDLLPQGATLLVAVSGGQDSIAMLGLLHGLISRHHWTLVVWHGNHQWQPTSEKTARELKEWCTAMGLKVFVAHANNDLKRSEAAAREWRYAELSEAASAIKADVVTGHTASDRTETILIQLARGTDLKGLSTLRKQRAMSDNQPTGCQIRRPMLLFDRKETMEICNDLKLPIWIDPSNANRRFTRNRIRHDIIPILEDLYPGCSRRMSAMAERLSTTEQSQQELAKLCLTAKGDQTQPILEILRQATPTTRTILIKYWLKQQGITTLNASLINQLSHRLGSREGTGCQHFPNGWRVHWEKSNLYAAQQNKPAC
jgi:tRNA(Ile)-lysidine synthase